MSFLSRSELLIGAEGLVKLKKSHILVIGLGGVGSYAAEALTRAGVGEMTIIDGDHVVQSNINRQLQALHSTINQSKSYLMAQRLMDINPELILHEINQFRPRSLSGLLGLSLLRAEPLEQMSRFSHKFRASYIPDPDGNLDAGNHLSWICRLIMRKFGRKNRQKIGETCGCTESGRALNCCPNIGSFTSPSHSRCRTAKSSSVPTSSPKDA